MSDDIKKEIWFHFKNMQTVFLATADGEQPKVRPVTLLYFNDRFWIGTGTNAGKIKQIKENKKVEFCLFIEEEEKSGYIRTTSEALIVHDNETRKLLAENMPYFRNFWKSPDDPHYSLFELVVKDVEYLKPGTFKIKKISV